MTQRRILTHILAALAVATIASQPAAAAGALTIAELAIGMPADAAEMLLKRAGWSLQRGIGRNWQEEVDQEWRRQTKSYDLVRPSGLGGLFAQKGTETLEISVKPVPAGYVLQKVIYRAPVAGRSGLSFLDQIRARYGTPSGHARGYRMAAEYCDRREPNCMSKPAPALPYLIAAYDDDNQGRVAIILDEG